MGEPVIEKPSEVRAIYKALGHLRGWYYVALDTEDDAKQLIEKAKPGEEVVDAKRVRNLDDLRRGEYCPVYSGPYQGPACP
jgi:hypothetical protein